MIRNDVTANGFNVLVIEDDPGLLQLVRKALSRSGYNSICASTGNEALSLLKQNLYDLLLIDYKLGDMNGDAIIRNLPYPNQNIPFIAITGEGNERTAVEFMKLGAKDYLIKDSTFLAHLPRVVEKVFSGISMERELEQAHEELKQYATKLEQAYQELEVAHDKEQHLAYHDSLTGLPNRKMFYSRLEQIVSEAARYKFNFGILFLDLDGFKQINDSSGHYIGDKVLQVQAERLCKTVRRSDTVARLGGDEFTLILSRINSEYDAITVAEGLIEAISQPIEIDGTSYGTSVSIGITLYPFDGLNVDDLVRKADNAMYRAKASGKSCWRLFDKTYDSKLSEHHSVSKGLAAAIERNELVCYYQPQVDLKTDGVVGFEALVRWRHPESGLVPPGRFIPAAERCGKINQIDIWMLNTACSQLASWKKNGFKFCRTAVNLNAKLFQDKELPGIISKILQRTGLEPESICLEITETQAMKDIRLASQIIDKLKLTGVLISMDDFGSGQTSLKYLSSLPIDILKIDRCFIQNIKSENNDFAIVESIMMLCNKLNIKVIAEGVETAKQLDALRSLGCHEYQGFYHSRPAAADSIVEFLRA